MSLKVKLNKKLFEGTPLATNQQQPNQAANNQAQQPQQQAAQPAQPAQAAQPAQQGQQPQQQAVQPQQQQQAQQQPVEKIPEVKPQINVNNAEQAQQPNLINGCLVGMVGLLNRPDAGGVYLKAIQNSKNASDTLKQAAQTFANIKPEDTNDVIQGFTTFANVCAEELAKAQQNQQQQQPQQNQQNQQPQQ